MKTSEALAAFDSKIDRAVDLALDIAKKAALDYVANTSRFRNRTGALRGGFIGAGSGFTRSVFVSIDAPAGRPKGAKPQIYAPFVNARTRFADFAQTAAEVALVKALERRLTVALG